MKIKIHRGTNQIGGCITEIESNLGTRIIIDIGANLEKIDGVLVTHYHGDHIGLYNKVLKDIPIYTSEITKELFLIVQTYLSYAKLVQKEDIEKIKKFNTFTIPNSFNIRDIKITPIMVDHSAFDSHMFLVECDGKKLLHTGDFRMHGQRGNQVREAVKKYVGKVDCLITEGTMFSRNDEKILTETELQQKAKEIFQDNKYNFILCSSTNIDRIAAFHKAAISANKMFICDNFELKILNYITSKARSNLYKFNDVKERKVYLYGNNMKNAMKENGFVILIRANDYFKSILEEFPNSRIIYSEWRGYLKSKDVKYKFLQDMVNDDYIYLHTSGHADKASIKEIIDITEPNAVIPIHTEHKEMIKELTNNSKILEDEEEFLII